MKLGRSDSEAMRVGVLGGTFDPIHYGHLTAAAEAHRVLELNRVLFLPAASPLHKLGHGVASAEDRVAMIELAIRSNAAFAISRVDVDRPGPSYTVDTITILQSRLGPSTQIFFIIGLDSLPGILTWKESERLLTMANLAVVNRPGYEVPDLDHFECLIPGFGERLSVIPTYGPDISSTELRQRIASGQSIKGVVPEDVEDFIHRNGLYHAWQVASMPMRYSIPLHRHFTLDRSSRT